MGDKTYSGYGSNWKAMYAVLQQKFLRGSNMAERLLLTGDAMLIEHNCVSGRDMIWSDNSDGSGTNWLGLMLMLIRDELQGTSEWTKFLRLQVNFETGEPLASQWPEAVRQAAQALNEVLLPADTDREEEVNSPQRQKQDCTLQ